MIELHDIKIINTTLLIYLCNEMIHMHGYDCYDYGARHSQTALGRFTTIDPLAEKYYPTSPYVLCGGNPVFRVDYNGMDWYSYRSSDTGTLYYKWFDSSERILYDAGIRYTRYGTTICAYTDDGSFIYGAQDGQTYTSAPLQEVSVFGDQSALMARSVHKAQKEFLTSDYAKMVAGLMGGMMAGPAALEYGYNAAVWAAPYVKSAAITTYNTAQYYGSTAIINGVKGYGKAKFALYDFLTSGTGSFFGDVFTGVAYGISLYMMSPDSPEYSINPTFDAANKITQSILYFIKLIKQGK